jgi:hypothetical protein
MELAATGKRHTARTHQSQDGRTVTLSQLHGGSCTMLPFLHTTRWACGRFSRATFVLTLMRAESMTIALGISGFSGMFHVLAQNSMLLELIAAQNSMARNS